MRFSYLTRHDADVGEGVYDSIAWAFEVHVKTPDTGEYAFAIVDGNEDAPAKIMFYTQAEPTINDTPAYIWEPTNG